MKTGNLLKSYLGFVVTLSLVALHPSLTAAQERLSRSPVNPAFEEYLAKRKQGVVSLQQNEMSRGYIPGPVKLPAPSGAVPALVAGPLALPSSYDLRTLGKLTPIRNQDGCGDCWAFATYSSLESCLLTNETWDFSENNLNVSGGFDIGCCKGGNSYMSAAYLARWSGPVSQSDDPETWTGCTTVSGVAARKHVQEVLFLPLRTSATDNNTIKQAVMTYGAVYTAILVTGGAGYLPPYSDAYYNASTYAYYYNGTAATDHAIAIVGWDDNFAASNFSTVPPGNGAFIIRNSWGTAWGQSGYFYISYYDTQIGMNENAVFENAEWTSNYSRVYQYDPLGLVADLGYCDTNGNCDTTAWFANVFTAIGAEQLRVVSFYTPTVNSSYQIYIYRNPTSPPIGGTPVSSMSGAISYPGYHTLALTTPVTLGTGQTFSVVIKLTTPGWGYPIPVEYAYPGYSSGATASSGQSYFSDDGTSWQDATTWDSTCNVCIKAFTSTAYLHVTAIALESNNVRITWLASGGQTNVVQVTNGTAGGYTNSFSDLSPLFIIPGASDVLTNYLDVGGATNAPSRFYRVRLVP
jgi:C1A family cysteine protease